MPASDFLDLPRRTTGLTHVIDKGLGRRAVEDLLEAAGDYVDIVKLGWGTAYVTRDLRAKLDVYRAFAIPVVIGGTFFEAVEARGKLGEYRRWLDELALTHVEISDGTLELPRERKLELIADFARDFTVLSEVGSKDGAVEFEPEQWTRWLQEELDAGAWKVVAEAREGGSAGIFTASGQMRGELVVAIAAAWLIKRFGPEVNLGNIPPEEVIPLETLRLGLRGDTLKEVLLGDRQPAGAS